MADGKWIPELTATTPLVDAARWALTVRLEVVRGLLPLALFESEQDVEYVHQLRVGTRRAGAALRIFRPCLPDKIHRQARRQLRRLRRAAGLARDWDVFVASMSARDNRRSEAQQPGLDFLAGYARAQRIAAQARLQEASPDVPFGFERFLAKAVAAVHAPHSGLGAHTLLELAQTLLPSLLGELNQSLAENLDDWQRLHQARIQGKQLRYAMELFAECFLPPFRQVLYPLVEEMQEILGRANDCQVARGYLTALKNRLRTFEPSEWKRYRAGIEGWLRFHARQLPQERELFLQWRQRWENARTEEEFRALGKAPRSEGDGDRRVSKSWIKWGATDPAYSRGGQEGGGDITDGGETGPGGPRVVGAAGASGPAPAGGDGGGGTGADTTPEPTGADGTRGTPGDGANACGADTPP
jgi:CHAD domain-containing protein